MTSQQLIGGHHRTGDVLGGRYEIRALLGQGGMAEVYAADDRLLGRRVAVKVLRAGLDADRRAVARFRREARAEAALSHPNIVAIHDVGLDGEQPFLVMELVPGETLSEMIWRDAPLPVERAAEIGVEVAEALAFAHDAGIVHRDVKPGNVMVTPNGRVKVVDFGIARAMAWTPLTGPGPVEGTAAYLSPEQVRGLPLDGRSDVYSLGIILYEMLAGVPPFRGDTPLAIAYRHVEEPPVPLESLRPSTPPGLAAIVMRCLSKDPATRYQSAARLASDLRAFRGSAPSPAAAAAIEPARPSVSWSIAPHRGTGTAELPIPIVGPATERRRAGLDRGRRGRRGFLVTTVVVLAVMIGAVAWVGIAGLIRHEPAATAAPPPSPVVVVAAPFGLTTDGACDGFFKTRVTLSWAPPNTGPAEGYAVYRSDGPGQGYEVVANVEGAGTTTFVDHRLNTNHRYAYRVRTIAGEQLSRSFAAAITETPLLCL
jgi:serine/threonine-protein kinase